MNEQELREQLQKLESELQGLPVGSAQRETISALIADLESQLDEGPVEALRERIQAAVTVFEAEHPRVAAVLNNIIVTLTSMGV